ncbi:hypothetical protein [Tissierella sp. Yu-01]|uniref:Athe_2463 domain-containing protein n=1 Tax=Tissierella sp. Yu-01 TaxID=3035694 RepID=UPI00240D5340|nr:hypothetical protein [Tissierella sp. Yu-01]WFA09585.1 hypothetical protein P3962_03255 [Tissierella sp. Yu-01]
MTKYRVLIISLIFLMFFSTITVYSKQPVSVETAVEEYNKMIVELGGKPNFIDISKVNRKVFEEYGALVYGSEHGEKENGESRFLGYVPNSSDNASFNNPKFRKDAWAGGVYETRNWFENPWKHDILKNKYKGTFVLEERPWQWNAEAYNDNMQYGLDRDEPTRTNGTLADSWHLYMEVLQPPSYYADGMARIFHQEKSGAIWYASFVLPADRHLPGKNNIRIGSAGKSLGDNFEAKLIDVETNKALDPETDQLVIGKKYKFQYFAGFETSEEGKLMTNNKPILTNMYVLYNGNENTGASDLLIQDVKDVDNKPYLEKANINNDKLNESKWEASKIDASKIAKYEQEFEIAELSRAGKKVEKVKVCGYLPYQHNFYKDYMGDTQKADNSVFTDDNVCIEFEIDNRLANTIVAHSPNNAIVDAGSRQYDRLEIRKYSETGQLKINEICPLRAFFILKNKVK